MTAQKVHSKLLATPLQRDLVDDLDMRLVQPYLKDDCSKKRGSAI